MVFGVRGPPLSHAEREAIARFRERRANGGTYPHASPSSRSSPSAHKISTANGKGGKMRPRRDHDVHHGVHEVGLTDTPTCAQGFTSMLDRVRESPIFETIFPRDSSASECASRSSRDRKPHVVRRNTEGGHGRDRQNSGTQVRAKLAGIGSRLKQFADGGGTRDANMGGDERRGMPMNSSRGLKNASFFKGRKKIGKTEHGMRNFIDDDEDEERREDDAYFHDLMHDGEDDR